MTTDQTEQPTASDISPAGVKQGDAPEMTTADQKHAAVEAAFDYRGDVTIHLADGSNIEGYVYDRRSDAPNACVKILQGTERTTIPWNDIERISFTGRDTAAGKSWETWVKKYQEKKAKGEAANIEAEALDE